MEKNTASAVYIQLIQSYKAQLQQLNKTKTILGWSRLVTILLTAYLFYQFFTINLIIASVIGVFGIGVFLFLLSRDEKNKTAIHQINQLIHINEEELRILNQDYFHRKNGATFLPTVHGYAYDLDVLGHASIYQYINRCNTEQGQKLLAHNLLSPTEKKIIESRQVSAKSLVSNQSFQQKLQSIAIDNPITIATEDRIYKWLLHHDESEKLFEQSFWKMVLPVFSFITLSSVALKLLDYINMTQLSIFLFVCFLISSALSKKILNIHSQLSNMVGEMDVLEQIISLIETTTFESFYLKYLQKTLLGNDHKASFQISNLKDILNRFDVRLNVLLFTILNTLFLWDVWQIRSLFAWKMQHNLQLKNWIATIAEIELINTLSILHFNNPSWSFPTIVYDHFTFQAKGLGHPLLPIDKSVTNAFITEGTGKIVLITGSNMAGKSTFLRAIGCNVVLALMGAPVCAEQLTLSPIRLLSSMRIADNLAESTSTFYAELKKLKSIIESVNKHENVLVLLDEILRGTNSLDRHTGSKALIKQFIRQNTIAILATHDVSLADEALVFPENITNYHFDVQVANDELFFDYKLKTGVCKSLNASILMRKIGIEMDKD